VQLSEKDTRAVKRKDSNDKSRMDDEMINDAGANQSTKPKIPNPSTPGPQDDNNPAKPHTNSPEKKRESDKDA
jgi:hypothetical protein